MSRLPLVFFAVLVAGFIGILLLPSEDATISSDPAQVEVPQTAPAFSPKPRLAEAVPSDDEILQMQGSSGRPVEQPSRVVMPVVYPRPKVAGTCPNDTFARTVPQGFGVLSGTPLSDCEQLPGTETASERGLAPNQAYGDPEAARVKSAGLDCDASASQCRKACLMSAEGTAYQTCQASCEIDRARCIQQL